MNKNKSGLAWIQGRAVYPNHQPDIGKDSSHNRHVKNYILCLIITVWGQKIKRKSKYTLRITCITRTMNDERLVERGGGKWIAHISDY